MVGRADNTLRFHPLDNSGGAIVADLQMALHEACRRLALTAYHRNGLSIKRVAGTILVFASLRIERAAIILGDFLDVIGFSTRLKERYNPLNFLIRDKRAVNTRDATATCHVQHVAAAQKLLCSTFPEDGAAVDLRRHLKAYSSGKICLDGARDNIN